MKAYNKVITFAFVVIALCCGCNKKPKEVEVLTKSRETVETEVIFNHSNDPFKVEDVGIDTVSFDDIENEILYNKASCDVLMLPERYIDKYNKMNDVIENDNNYSIDEAKNFIEQNKNVIRQMINDRNDDTLVLSFENIKTVNRIDDLVFSYNEEVSSYTGGAHGSYALIGKNYEPKEGKEITSSDMFVDRKRLHEVLVEKISNDYEGDLFEDWKDTLDIHFNEHKSFNFSVGPQYVEIIFDPYYLGPWATGNITVLLLYEEHKDILNKKYFE